MSTKKTENIETSRRPRKLKGLRAQDPWLERERERYENPLPSREYILQILTERGAPTEVAELAKQLSITQSELPFFERRIGAMAREAELMINRKGALCLPEKVDSIVGRVQGHQDGFGFLVPDDGSDDLYLGPKEMDKVLHGDRVLGQQIGFDRRGRREGKIIEVVDRANIRLVGRFHVERGVAIVAAEEKRISQDFLIPPKEVGKAQPGQVVMIEIIQQPARHVKPLGRVVEVLGNYDDPGMEIEIALRKHNLPHEFSKEAEAQGQATPKKVRKVDWKPVDGVERVDLTELPLVTIDGETARDFDDAVYAEKKGKGWRLIVAIADVSHYVQPNDALDQTSIERGNSVYFPRRVIPMLPEALSNGICSLNPEVERLCMVCDMQVAADGEIKKYKFYPAVMLSKARLTYTKVWDMLSNPKGDTAKEYKKVLPHLETLYALFQTFAKARQQRGAIDFETTETEIRFDEFGKIREIVPVVRNDAHKLIEECMLAANVCAANFLIEKKHPVLFRVHEGPTEQKLDKLREYLRSCGLSLPGEDDPSAKDYAQLLEKIKLRPDASLLQTMLLRSLSQAVYSPDNAGHFGLSYEAYAHFTSPIRRYPDLLVHRSIKAVLAGKKYKPAQKWDQLGVQCSMTERRADEASRDVLNFLKCYFMRDKVGESFEGTISAVTNFGLFVLLDDLYVEGLVHISELGKDYFQFDDRRHELRGERSGQIYKLMDRVKVRVVRVDMETNKIDFVLLEERGVFTPQPVSRAPDNKSGGRKPAGNQRGGQRTGAASYGGHGKGQAGKQFSAPVAAKRTEERSAFTPQTAPGKPTAKPASKQATVKRIGATVQTNQAKGGAKKQPVVAEPVVTKQAAAQGVSAPQATAGKSAAQPAPKPAAKPSVKSSARKRAGATGQAGQGQAKKQAVVAKPVVTKPAAKPAPQVARLLAPPVPPAVAQPVAAPAAKPASKPAAKSATKPAAQPVVTPTAAPRTAKPPRGSAEAKSTDQSAQPAAKPAATRRRKPS